MTILILITLILNITGTIDQMDILKIRKTKPPEPPPPPPPAVPEMSTWFQIQSQPIRKPKFIDLTPPMAPGNLHIISPPPPSGQQLVDNLATAKTQALWSYFKTIYGNHIIAGLYTDGWTGPYTTVYSWTGKYVGMVATDLSGWAPYPYHRWTSWPEGSYIGNITNQLGIMRNYWNSGGTATVQWHMANPMLPYGDFLSSQDLNINLNNLIIPGTPEYNIWWYEVEKHIDYIKSELTDYDVPLLFRPFHEIDGGWFWWTGWSNSTRSQPEVTAQMWRDLYNYCVNTRGLHNLIWVYSMGISPANRAGRSQLHPDVIGFRQRMYPGDAYVDIIGIDIYDNQAPEFDDPKTDDYPIAWTICNYVTPNKMKALTECGAYNNPDMLAADGPWWLYELPWFYAGEQAWFTQVMPHPIWITRDELPAH